MCLIESSIDDALVFSVFKSEDSLEDKFAICFAYFLHLFADFVFSRLHDFRRIILPLLFGFYSCVLNLLTLSCIHLFLRS